MSETTDVPQEVWDPQADTEVLDRNAQRLYLTMVLQRDAGLIAREVLTVLEVLDGNPRIYWGVTPPAPDLSRISEHVLHQMRAHPDFEYASTTSPRKGDGRRPDGEGWEPNDVVPIYTYAEQGVPGPVRIWRNWEREDYYDVEHWRRRKTRPNE